MSGAAPSWTGGANPPAETPTGTGGNRCPSARDPARVYLAAFSASFSSSYTAGEWPADLVKYLAD